MSGPESMPPDDQLLEEFLAGRGAVREAYRASASPQPPVHLDAAILAAACSAASAAPRRLRSRWQVPVTAAAVVVLSFGVFVQVQRDPAAQKQVLATPPVAATAATGPADAAAPAAAAIPVTPPLADAAGQDDSAASTAGNRASRTEASAVAELAQAPVVAAKPKRNPDPKREAMSSTAPRKAAPRDPATRGAAPPPAPSASPSAPVMDAFVPSPAPAAALAPESMSLAPPPSATEQRAQAAAENAAERDDSQRERAAMAAAPMAKSRRVMPTDHQALNGEAVVAETAQSQAIEQWARRCVATAVGLEAPTLWRGLPVTAWTRAAEGDGFATTLHFAPSASREAIAAALGVLALSAPVTTAQCAVPETRELRQSGKSWTLVCACAQAAE